MSLFEDLLRKGVDKLDDDVLDDDRFDKLVDDLSDQLDKVEDGYIKNVGKASLQELVSRKNEVLHLKKSGLAIFMAHLAGGKTHEAQLEFIRNTDDADDLIAGMIEDARVVARQKKSEEEWKASALELIQAIGIKGAQVILPLLLAAI